MTKNDYRILPDLIRCRVTIRQIRERNIFVDVPVALCSRLSHYRIVSYHTISYRSNSVFKNQAHVTTDLPMGGPGAGAV